MEVSSGNVVIYIHLYMYITFQTGYQVDQICSTKHLVEQKSYSKKFKFKLKFLINVFNGSFGLLGFLFGIDRSYVEYINKTEKHPNQR